MKVLVVGSGGREHAIIAKIQENPQVTQIYALPGNGGIGALAACAPVKATDIEGIRAFALAKGVDFAVVAPDDPLVLGAVDLLEEAGIPCFGPNRAAAEIEGSKVFAKRLMQKHGIPTADYQVMEDAASALQYCRGSRFPLVIKADGLALGKGVTIAESLEQATYAIENIMEKKIFGASGNRVVFEEFLTGPEVSVLCFTDGHTIAPLVSSMDHKRVLDGDAGPNTGGMGAVAPNPFYTPEIAAQCMREIFEPTIAAMRAEGRPFKGCLYFGLMLTDAGPRVIEYNCRFGDPETQVVLPLLKTDLLTIMRAVAAERLHEVEIEFHDASACCVVLTSGGYPSKYETGLPITIGAVGEAQLFHAGTALQDGQLVTAGGRVIGVTCTGQDLAEARRKAYAACQAVHFQDMYYRRDIGARALQALS